jgi:very-short-patch-repair endonuclease
MDLDATIRRIATTQHGLISRRQLRSAGADLNFVHRRVKEGVLERISTCVLRIAGSADTPAQRALAAVLDVGERAVLSHSSSASWWQCPGFGLSPIHTTRLRGGRNRENHISTVHQPLALADEHITMLFGVPVTTPARTIFDLAGTEPFGRTERAVDYMLSRRLTNTAELHHLLQVLARKGRPGITVMRHLLAERPLDMRYPDTNLERHFREIARRVGIVDLDSQVDIFDATGWIARVDFLHRPRRVVFEIDSVVHHSSVSDRRRDDATTARLEAAGYTVERFGETQIFFEKNAIMTTLRTLLLAA